MEKEQLLKVKEGLEEYLQIKEARKKFSTFCQYVFGLKPGKIHIEWHNLATKAMKEGQPCVIFACRSHGKTTYLSVLRVLFLLGHNPNLRIKIVSHSDKKSADILRQIKEAIEYNEKLRKVFPHLKPGPVWAANKILVERDLWSKDVTIEALGVLSGATGGRCVVLGTKILTDKGFIPIEEIKEGDYVIGKSGRFRRVEKTWKRPYKGKIICFNTCLGGPIKVTPEHRILAFDLKLRSFWICAKDFDDNRHLFFSPYNKQLEERFRILKTESLEGESLLVPCLEKWEEEYEGFVYDLTVDQDGSFCSFGVTLKNSDYIIFDDIVEFKNTIQNPALIPMVKEAFYNNWLNLLEPNGYGWCLVGTIWTQMDLHWELHQKPFKYKKVYRIDLNTLEPIWPEHWPKEKLLERYNSMPLRAFARAFGNVPISREDAVFFKEHIDKCIVFNHPEKYREKCDFVILGVDLAISQKKSSANTAIFVLGVMSKKEKLVALHIEYGKWSSPETVRAIMKIFDDWKADLIVVENNQYQEALVQWLEEFNRSLPIKTHYTTASKFDPEIGLPSMSLEFERGKWIIPIGKIPHESDCKCGFCQWINEMIMYPFAERSDILMASYFAREGYRKYMKQNNEIEIDSW